MSTVKKNLFANFSGSIWTGLMGIAFVPLYIRFMGVESYGLIGIFATFQALSILFDMGLSTTLIREMARLSAQDDTEQEMRNFVRSLEVIYWCIAVVLCIALISLSHFIAHRWINASHLSPQTIEHALKIMVLALALQWPSSLYSGGLMGLQKQVLLNAINSGMSTLRGIGAVMVLWIISPTINAYFSWQIIVSTLNTFLMAFFLWKSLPHSHEKSVIQKKVIKRIWHFSASMSGITITGLILTQLDKLILSHLLTLEAFGYYSLAALVASFLYRLNGPFYSTMFPRFSELVIKGNEMELKELYHKSCQLLSVLLFPPAMILAFFSLEILEIWTGDPITSSKTYIILTLMVIGATLNGSLTIPGVLVLSYGWTSLALYTHIISILFLGPTIYFLTLKYGILGAPVGWIIYNLCNMLITVNIMHLRLLKKEKWGWYFTDIGIPMTMVAIVVSVWHIVVNFFMITNYILFILIGAMLTATVVAAFSTPSTRFWVLSGFKNTYTILRIARNGEKKVA